MKIVVVGAKERDTEEDRVFVCDLMDRIASEAPHTTFVTTLTHMGVGKFAKEYGLTKDENNHYKFQLIECSVRIYAQYLSKSELAQVYLARNATVTEMGDMLIYLASEDRRGTCEDLLSRFRAAGRPTLVLMPGDALPEHLLAFSEEFDGIQPAQ
jgi:2-methylaconitate cis-trans-isomerase PrpF